MKDLHLSEVVSATITMFIKLMPDWPTAIKTEPTTYAAIVGEQAVMIKPITYSINTTKYVTGLELKSEILAINGLQTAPMTEFAIVKVDNIECLLNEEVAYGW